MTVAEALVLAKERVIQAATTWRHSDNPERDEQELMDAVDALEFFIHGVIGE